MLEKLESVLRGPCGLNRSSPIIVGVSGGPDSLCLMDVLHQAGYEIVVAHFNHKLRAEAEAEADAVKQLAAHSGLPFAVGSADVNAHAEANRLSLEEAARHLRYRFLFEQARRLNAQAVAVGHTADDQVETVLMHLMRGAGLDGLKGMSYSTVLPTFDSNIPVVRPLLDVWREETVAYCAAHALQPQYDPSNDSAQFLRNRIRRELIPALETYNPKFREAVWRMVQLLNADQAILNETVNEKWNRSLVRQTDKYVMLDFSILSGYSVGMQRHLIRRAAENLMPEQEAVFSALERASDFLADSTSIRMDLAGGLRLFREEDALYITKPDAELPLDRWPQMPAQIDFIGVSVPGQVNLSGCWQFSAEKWPRPESAWEESSRNEDRFRVWLDAEDLPDIVELRVHREGDRFEPLGLGGHSQKLSDFFTNEKLAVRARARWPLLCAGERILWVPGFRPAESVKLKQTSRRVIYFSVAGPRAVT